MLFYNLNWHLQHATLNAFILSIRWYQVCLPVHAKAVWLCAHGKLVTMPNSKFTSGIQRCAQAAAGPLSARTCLVRHCRFPALCSMDGDAAAGECTRHQPRYACHSAALAQSAQLSTDCSHKLAVMRDSTACTARMSIPASAVSHNKQSGVTHGVCAGTSKAAETQHPSQRKEAWVRIWAVICAASTFNFETGQIDPVKAAVEFRSPCGAGASKLVKESHATFCERHYKNFSESSCIADAHRAAGRHCTMQVMSPSGRRLYLWLASRSDLEAVLLHTAASVIHFG